MPRSSIQVFAIPLLGRSGCFLLAVPAGSLSDEILLDAAIEEEGSLGPSRDFEASLLEEDDAGSPQDIGVKCSFLVIDCSDQVCACLRKYDLVTDSTETIIPFSNDRPVALPVTGEALNAVREWIESVALSRQLFTVLERSRMPPQKQRLFHQRRLPHRRGCRMQCWLSRWLH